jgi:hypothetical protein
MASAATNSKREDPVSAYHRSLADFHKAVRVPDVREGDTDQGFKLEFPFPTVVSENRAPNTPQSPKSPPLFAHQAVVIFEGRQLTEFPFSQVDSTPNQHLPNTTASKTILAPPATSSSSTLPTQANASVFEVMSPAPHILTDGEIDIFRTLWTREFPTAFCQPAHAVNEWLSRQDEKIWSFGWVLFEMRWVNKDGLNQGQAQLK